ncbi:hypothetical protein FB451DRAFT_772981 [Mycena latifolia]|nr:hypothetical protein FB451DRAFT_772981 [Mycena latifolia]
MPSLLVFACLFCCGCLRPRGARQDVESGGQIIPTETTSLIPPPPPAQITVDHQALGDKLSRIVRAKEGKMVSVAARAPFAITIQPRSAESAAGPNREMISRRPPVLTMTPARSVNLYSYADGNSRHSSSSCSSSRRRPHSEHSQAGSSNSNSNSGSASNSTSNLTGDNHGGSASARAEPMTRSEVVLESASEADEPPTPSDPKAITFSWAD